MVDFWTGFDITIACIPILCFIISTFFLLRAKRIHSFVGLLWAIGLVTSIVALLLTTYFHDQNFGNTWGGFTVIFLLESGQGVLYFMVAFEFYTSAITMEEILLKKAPSVFKHRKNTIFTSVTFVYVLL